MNGFDLDATRERDFLTVELASMPEGGDASHSEQIPAGVTAAIVLVEGEGEVTVRIGDRELEDDNETTFVRRGESRSVYVKIDPVPRGGQSTLGVQARTREGSRLKILVVFLRRNITLFWRAFRRRLSCKGCKRLVRALIAIALACVVYIDWPTDQSLPESPDVLRSIEQLASGDPSGLPDVVRRLFERIDSTFVRRVFRAIHGALTALDFAFEFADMFYAAVCRRLGFCPE